MKSLRDISVALGTNKLRHNYEPFYERVLGHLRNDPIKLLEIGVYHPCSSLRMWREYFPKAEIFGFAIYPDCMFNEDRITTMLVNQSKRAELKQAMQAIGKVDVIVDDGSHNVQHQQISFGYLFQWVRPGGVYFVEDVQSSWFCGTLKTDDVVARQIKQMGIAKDLYNTTYVMLKNYEQFGEIRSQYMTPGELSRLNANISSFELNIQRNFESATCAIGHQ